MQRASTMADTDLHARLTSDADRAARVRLDCPICDNACRLLTHGYDFIVQRTDHRPADRQGVADQTERLQHGWRTFPVGMRHQIN